MELSDLHQIWMQTCGVIVSILGLMNFHQRIRLRRIRIKSEQDKFRLSSVVVQKKIDRIENGYDVYLIVSILKYFSKRLRSIKAEYSQCNIHESCGRHQNKGALKKEYYEVKLLAKSLRNGLKDV